MSNKQRAGCTTTVFTVCNHMMLLSPSSNAFTVKTCKKCIDTSFLSLHSDMEGVCLWRVCMWMLCVCIGAQSSLDRSDHAHLDHQHHHLASNCDAASGRTHTVSVCLCVILRGGTGCRPLGSPVFTLQVMIRNINAVTNVYGGSMKSDCPTHYV